MRRSALGDDILALTLLLALVLPLGLAASDLPSVKVALLLAFAVIVSTVLLAVLAAQGRLPGLAGPLVLCMLPYALVMALRGGFFHVAYLAAIASVVLLSASARCGKGFWRITVLATGVLSGGYVALWISEGAQFQFSGWMTHKNFLGIQLFFMAVATVCAMQYLRDPFERLLCIAVLAVLALLLVVSSSRASLLAAGVFLAAFVIWPFLARRRRLLKTTFVLTLALSIMIVPLYILLWLSPLAAPLDEWSLSMTGQVFFSGRQYVWPVYMLVIADAPLLGHGFAFDRIIDPSLWEGLPEHYAELSAHNLYLMIAVQTGVAGLLAFCFFITGVWNLIARAPANPAFRIAGPALLAFLLHEIFEVSLVQNNLIAAWPMWMLVGFALSPHDDHPH